jgi:hypothetical protein
MAEFNRKNNTIQAIHLFWWQMKMTVHRFVEGVEKLLILSNSILNLNIKQMLRFPSIEFQFKFKTSS